MLIQKQILNIKLITRNKLKEKVLENENII